MDVQGSEVGVVGGSIAGCAAAVALGRLGCDVQVFERSSGALRDRGSGIAIPLALRDELIAARYLPADYPSIERSQRNWVVADGTDFGRTVWVQPGIAALNNWGVLWRGLRSAVPDERYHDGHQVTGVADDGDGVTVDFADGSARRFDIVIGADGYRSEVRAALLPGAQPDYAGYVLWRGNFPESELSDGETMARLDAEQAWLTVGFEGGHGVMYTIPDFDDGTGPGSRRVNWAIYAPQPEGLDFADPTSIPPGAVSEAHYGELQQLLHDMFPPRIRPLFASPRGEVSIQPIYDQSVESYIHGRIVLIGDAGTVSRPHTGSGATKAMQDARLLETLGGAHTDWSSLLAAYDADRSAVGRSLVQLGRRIGHDQVERTPPWGTMTAADFEEWISGTLSGESLYFYGDSSSDEDARGS